MRVGVLTGGGDCPGLNAVIRAIVRRGVKEFGYEFVGFRDGWKGPLEGLTMPLGVAEVRGIPVGEDCISPARHAEFTDTDSMLDWIEMVADETGLPVGIKSAVGNLDFWDRLVGLMAAERAPGGRGVDFVNVDGGEGGTGAAPLVFTDSVAYPFRLGFARVYRMFAQRGLHEDVTFIGSGKLGLPDNAVVAFALGADMVNVAREAMLAVGCVQAQKCHTGDCPTGVATQNRWLAHGLDPLEKASRVENYVKTLRRDLLKVAETCGVEHPALIGPDSVEVLDTLSHGTLLDELYGYEPGWGYPSARDRAEIAAIMAAVDEEESRTQGPPESAEDGRRSDDLAGDLTSDEVNH